MTDKAAHAAALLNNPAFIETMEKIEQAAIEAALNAPRHDD